MNVINELETRTTAAEKMKFLESLQNDLQEQQRRKK